VFNFMSLNLSISLELAEAWQHDQSFACCSSLRVGRVIPSTAVRSLLSVVVSGAPGA
jgi:hypothetical protein